MDSSQLLKLQLAKKLECTRNGICIGPIGLTGPTGPTGPIGPAGYQKMFTFYIDFSSATAISRMYIPPEFSTDPNLSAGGIFTSNISGILTFTGTTNILIASTTYAFPIGLSATGYFTGNYWSPSAYANLGGAGATWQNTSDYTLSLKGITPGRLNGGNVASKYKFLPGTTIPDATGWLATLTIYYL